MLAAHRFVPFKAITAPTFIASTSSASSSSGVTSKSLATPTCQVGDRLIFAIESFLAAPSAAPTGWTLIPGVTGHSVAGADSSYLNVYERTADSTDAAGTTYTVTFTSSTPTCVAMLSYRGTAGVDVSAIVTRTTEDAGADTPSVTTTQANDVVLSIFGRNYTSSVNAANSAPIGTTARAEAHTTAFDGILVADEVKATAGATTSRHMNAASNGVFVTAAVALKGT